MMKMRARQSKNIKDNRIDIMFCIPDVNFFNGFNMILNENVIDSFLEENNTKQIEKEKKDLTNTLTYEDDIHKVYNEPIEIPNSLPQQRTYEYKQIPKKVAKILHKHKKHSNK